MATTYLPTKPIDIDMSPRRALALALLVIDEAIDFSPLPETTKERNAFREWLAELRAARPVIAEMQATAELGQ